MVPIPGMNSPLCQKAYRLLNEQGPPLSKVCQDTGLNFYWLQSFAAGKIPDPAVSRVQTLYEYLTDTKLEV